MKSKPSRVPSVKNGVPFSETEPNYFIFVAADVDKSRTYMPSAHEVATFRLEKKEWGVTRSTKCIYQVKPEDRILVYVSGYRENARAFIACATVSSCLLDIKHGLGYNIDSPTNDRHVVSNYLFQLKDIQLFPTPIPLAEVKEELEFIPTGTKYYGVYLQGGIRRLSEHDYDLVCSNAGLTW